MKSRHELREAVFKILFQVENTELDYKELLELEQEEIVNSSYVNTTLTEIIDKLEEMGLYDWLKLPDGSDAWSDYGLGPIYKHLKEYDSSMPPEKVIVLINKDFSDLSFTGSASSTQASPSKIKPSKRHFIHSLFLLQ